MGMDILYLNHGPGEGSWNMAVDQFLLQDNRPWLRFYQWRIPTLSLGYFQSTKEIDHESRRKNQVDLVRRRTGGKAVLHHLELTYSLALPLEWFPGPVKESYRLIGTWLLKGLHSLEIPCSWQEQIPEEGSGANCFKSPGWYEITLRGKKLLGSAQTRKGGKLLQHGSILLDRDSGLWRNLFADNHSLEESISLKEWMDAPMDISQLKEQFLANPIADHKIDPTPHRLEPSELKEIEEIQSKYFGSKEWTFRI